MNPEPVVSRLRLLGTAGGVGVGLGLVTVPALAVVLGGADVAVEKAFALGALVFGVGLLGWSGSVMAGRGIEAMQEHLGTNTGWTEADSRRAMTRLVGAGLGTMVGTVLASLVP